MIVLNQPGITKLLASMAVLLAVVIFISVKNNISIDGETSNIQTSASNEIDKAVSGFSLIDHNDNNITSATFRGRWTFVFFGFTNCPDVCPATLSQLVQINTKISQNPSMAGKFKTLFVSVDPDRDGTKHIKEYVKYFDPSFIGATGKMNNIIKFEKQFGAFHIIDNKSKENYNVGHTSSVFLVNPDGIYIKKFTPPMDVSGVMQQLTLYVEKYKNI